MFYLVGVMINLIFVHSVISNITLKRFLGYMLLVVLIPYIAVIVIKVINRFENTM